MNSTTASTAAIPALACTDPVAVGPPTGLTVDDAIRIAAAISAAHTESTRTVYAAPGGCGNAGAPPAASRR